MLLRLRCLDHCMMLAMADVDVMFMSEYLHKYFVRLSER